MHYFKFIFFLLSVSLITGCGKNNSSEYYDICSIDSPVYHVGDTVNLTACSKSNSYKYDFRWTVKSNGQQLFENYNLNTYFVIPEKGNYIFQIETIENYNNGNYNTVNKESRFIESIPSISIVVYKRYNLVSPIQVTIKEYWSSQIIDQGNLNDYILNTETPSCDHSSNSNQVKFFNLPYGKYVIESNYITGSGQTWTDVVTINELSDECTMIELH